MYVIYDVESESPMMLLELDTLVRTPLPEGVQYGLPSFEGVQTPSLSRDPPSKKKSPCGANSQF